MSDQGTSEAWAAPAGPVPPAGSRPLTGPVPPAGPVPARLTPPRLSPPRVRPTAAVPAGWDPSGEAPEWLARTEDRQVRGTGRPTFREPLPVRPGPLALGLVGGVLWMALFAAQAVSARGYVWLTITAAVLGSLVAGVLVRRGDRGVAVGVAAAAGAGLAIAALVVVARWSGGAWLLW